MRVLYLTYDGITSLIGQSQVWPYLRGLAGAGHRFDLVSFEHADRLAILGGTARRETARHGVSWHPRNFRTRPPLLAKLIDQRDMLATAGRLAAGSRFDMVHARSYVATDAALTLKRRFGLPYIFDMRGFWVDQRSEGNHWPQSNPFYRALYRRWKAKEAAMIANAAHIVVLAEAARRVVEAWDSYRGQPITVIPCCIDHDAFALRTPAARAAARARLGIAPEATVLAYLGSLGTVYLLDDMLRFFGRLRQVRPGARFLFIGRHSAAQLTARARALGIDAAEGDILVQPAEHGEVPGWLAAADLAIGLVQQHFASQGVSLTKLGEYLACGLPVIVNDRVGDVREIVEGVGGGAVLSGPGQAEMDRALSGLNRILAIDPAGLRERSRRIHDMPVALEKYRQVYDGFAGAALGATA